MWIAFIKQLIILLNLEYSDLQNKKLKELEIIDSSKFQVVLR